MAWTASLVRVTPDSVHPTAVVIFSDGKFKREETIDLSGTTAASFRARVEVMRAGYETSFAFIDTLTVSFDLTPVVPPDPTPKELAARAYLVQRARLDGVLRDVTAGILAADAKEVTELIAAVAAARVPST